MCALCELKSLRAEVWWLREENRLLRTELTKINNVVQPLWAEMRQLREDFGRNPQTGEAALAAKEGEKTP